MITDISILGNKIITLRECSNDARKNQNPKMLKNYQGYEEYEESHILRILPIFQLFELFKKIWDFI